MVVAGMFVMMELTGMKPSGVGMRVMVPVSVGMRMMTGSLMKLGGPLDLPKPGMQYHGHSMNPQVRQG
jgi:hypothetical protein